MKKLLSIILVFVMLCSTFAGLQITTHALSSSGNCGENVTYTFDFSTCELVISGSGEMYGYWGSQSPFYKSNIKSVVINNSVTSIGMYVFEDCSKLKSIKIPKSVTKIARSAFLGCESLTNITIPDSITSIGDTAFTYCSGLTSITIPNSVTKIGWGAFSHCSGLTSITISNSVTSIGSNAFYDCIELTSVTIPKSVTNIDYLAFYNCCSLKSIFIPDSVTSVVERAFYGCSKLNDIYYAGSKDNWNSINILEGNESLTNANIHFNFESIPTDFDTYFSNWIVDNYDYIYSTEMPASELTKNASEENKLQNGFIQSMKHVFDGKTVEEAQKEFYDAILYDLITNTYSMPNFNEYLKKDLAKISKDITDYAINKGFELLKPVNGAAKNELYEYLMDWLGVDKPFYELSYDVFSAITEGSDNAQECIEKISKYISLKQEAEKLQASLTAIRDNTDKQPLKQAVNQVLDSLSMSPGEIAAKVVKDETTSTVFESIIVDGFKHLFSTILKISIPVDEIKAFIDITYSLNDIFFGTTVTSDQEIRLYFYAHIEKACRAGFANATNNYSASKSATDAHILVNCYDMYLRIYEHQIKECLNYADVFYNAGLFAGLKKLFAKGTYESATAWIDSFSYKAIKLKEAKEEAYNAWGISTGTKKLVYLISFVNGQYAMCEKYYVDTGDGFYCNLSKFDKYMEKLFSLGLLKGQTLSFEGYYRDNELKNEFSGYLQAVNETSAVYVNYLLENKVTSPSGKPTGVKCAARTAAAEKITWNKASGISGYQVQLLTSSGKNAGLITTTATSYVFTKLVAGHAYKARVRFYNKDNSGKMYYGAWSTINSPTLPAGSGLTKLTPAKKAFTAQWKKVAVTGYQLQYGTNAKFSGAKTLTVKGKTAQALKSLKGGARYYVRVRTFKTIGGKNYFSTWSGAKAVTTKK